MRVNFVRGRGHWRRIKCLTWSAVRALLESLPFIFPISEKTSNVDFDAVERIGVLSVRSWTKTSGDMSSNAKHALPRV